MQKYKKKNPILTQKRIFIRLEWAYYFEINTLKISVFISNMAYIDRYNPHKWKIFGVLNKFLERKGVLRPLGLRTITTNINNVSNKCMSFKMPKCGQIIYIKKITSFLTELIQSLKKSINSSAKKISLSNCFQADI